MDTKILCIFDGFGLSKEKKNNAVAMADTPNIDMIFKKYNMVEGEASGLAVGLPDGQMGNSEVGHLNIGAGRIVYQELTRITKSIEDGDFFKNEELLNAIEHVKKNNSSLHIYGLMSPGGVHSHISHLLALLKMAKLNKVKNTYVHAFMDGRDTGTKDGINYIEKLIACMDTESYGEVASICGRYYAMDRDKNYDRTKKAYDLLTKGEGAHFDCPICALEDSYKRGVTDEFIEPATLGEKDDKKLIRDNDAIIFFNFRPDRARQITRAFVDDDFDGFDRKKLNNLYYLCFTDYDEKIKNKHVAFKKEEIKNTLGEYLASKNMTQLRCAETEKYAHVTFFFNGGVETPNKGEDRVLVPSPKDVPTYDLKPEMSAREVCENVLNGIRSEKYNLIVVNFANPDMVGHTGVLEAAIKAIEVVDECLGKIYKEVEERNLDMIIIADHGNSEKMVGDDKKPYTAHTSNPVPFCLINNKGYKLDKGGKLSDIAPTILDLMNIEKPKEMTGRSLLIK